MLFGASLSLSGPFERQGAEARDGLRLWIEHWREARDDPPWLIVLDDRSRSSLAREHVRRLLAEERSTSWSARTRAGWFSPSRARR